MPTGDEWIDAFAARLGAAAPSAEERKALLALAGIAAHESERFAAPIACFIAGTHGVTPADALAAARALRGEQREPDDAAGTA